MPFTKDRTRAVISWIVIVASVYFTIAITVHRFRHPEKTETQLISSIPEALLWR